MFYNTFLFTRDNERDYGWRLRPHEISDKVHDVALSLMDQVNMQTDLCNEDWKKIFFIFFIDDNGFIARVIPTNEMDLFGRQILSFEGLSFQGSCRRRIMDIPSIVSYLELHGNTIRDDYYSDNSSNYSGRVNIESTYDYFEESRDVESIVFKNIVSFIVKSGAKTQIVYGQKANLIRLPDYWACFIAEEENTMSNNKIVCPELEANYLTVEYGNSLKTMIKFEQCDKMTKYYWNIIDKSGKALVMKGGPYYSNGGISIERLIEENESIYKYFSLVGGRFNK